MVLKYCSATSFMRSSPFQESSLSTNTPTHHGSSRIVLAALRARSRMAFSNAGLNGSGSAPHQPLESFRRGVPCVPRQSVYGVRSSE